MTRTYSGVRGAPHRLQAVRPSTRLAVVILSAEESQRLVNHFLFLRLSL
jgi:hypothetical protein